MGQKGSSNDMSGRRFLYENRVRAPIEDSDVDALSVYMSKVNADQQTK